MSRVSGCLWLGVALILAVIAGGAAFVTLQKAAVAKPAEGAPTATTSIVVAAHPMPVGALLGEADLTLQDFPSGVVPAGALSAIGDVQGQLTTVQLDAGEMILAHHLTRPDIAGDNLAFTLPEGLVGVTLPAEDLLSQVSVIKAGDRVDILYSLEIAPVSTAAGTADTTKKQYTFGTLQGVTVVSVVASGTQVKPAESGSLLAGGSSPQVKVPVAAPQAYILALEPQNALVLKYLKDAGAIMDLALRNVADETDHTTQPVDLQYLIDKFQLQQR